MILLAIAALGVVSFATSWAVTWSMIRLSPRIGFIDKPGGRKIHANAKPLGGGVGIFVGMAMPMIVGFLLLHAVTISQDGTSQNAAYLSGALQQSPLLIGVLLAMLAIHVLGLLDDRKSLGPYFKLTVQLGITAALVIGMEILAKHTPSLRLRALTALDGSLGLGPAPSIILTVLWIAGITNAFNFLDNMDGLSAGVAAVSTMAFLVTAISIQQWFVAAMLALLLGALIGFLLWNFPPAKIFMGDSGSLLIGLTLGVLTIRTTYLPPDKSFGAGWYAVFAPVIVLALPMYDLIVVSVIRIARGKSPFVGDTNHFSHRLVARGMSKRTAVLCLYLITAATAVAAIVLPHVQSTFAAILIFAQTMLILGMVALLEQHPLPPPPLPAEEGRPAVSNVERGEGA
jgi:UDP-GlcNAc:undecaprenyl-phosphate/decaprenyl-phosphate GlcNAc-1-phosphate transferase